MAEDIARLVVALEARTRSFEKALEKAQRVTVRRARRQGPAPELFAAIVRTQSPGRALAAGVA